MSFLSARNFVLYLFKKDDSFGEYTFNSMLMVILVNGTGVPVSAWFDTPKFIQYLHTWEQFQVGSNSEFLKFCVNSK
jgi:hypothetical protein